MKALTVLLVGGLLAAVVAFAGFVGAGGTSPTKSCQPWPKCRATTTATTAAKPITYVFDDEFNGVAGQPDPAKWWRSSTCGPNPALNNCWKVTNASLDGVGRLVLKATTGTMGRPYDGARVQTLAGDWPPAPILASVSAPVHVEAYVKFAPGAGLWESFWFTRADSTSGDLEFDVQEFRGAHPMDDTCHTHIALEWGSTINTGFDGSAGWHTYWMNYYTDHVVFGVDGLTCGQTNIPLHPAEIIRLQFDVGVPGTWGGDGGPPPPSAIPAYMYVDYVRAWRI